MLIKNLISFLLKTIYPIFRKIFPYQVFAYLCVGAANTALNIVLFILFYWVLQHSNFALASFALEVATIISFVITVFTGFWLSKNFAFENTASQKREVQKQFGKYFLVSLQGQFSDYLITKFLVVILAFNGSVAYILSTIIMLILNYFLQKYYTFKRNK